MKWLVIVLLVLVIAGALWFRAVRSAGGVRAARSHRLDDSLSGQPDAADGAPGRPAATDDEPGSSRSPGG